MRKMWYNIGYIFRKELKAVFGDSAVLTFFIALTLVYPVVYTYIYSNETVFDVPVAVVDRANGYESREFIRAWDASSGVAVVAKCRDMEEARQLLYEKKIYGILEIPADFDRDLVQGRQAHVSLYCDMGALLNYKALLQAASSVAIGMGKAIQVEGLPYASVKQQELTASPVRMEEVKIFNPQSGYATFIIPAILILVIQQSLLLGVGTLAGTARERNRFGRVTPSNGHYADPVAVVVGKALAYLPVYILMSVWIFVVVPGIFNLTRIGDKWELFLFLTPFLLACVFLAMALSFLCRQRETPFLIFVFTSVPLMFMSGISWPSSAIPDYWVFFSKLFPSTYGIEGYVKINSLGASFGDVRGEFLSLWILVAVYFVLACFLYYCEGRRIRKTFSGL
ncbi:putative uncharacterized protein [Odoribacter sp. CAG:788]|jgi:ABC-2 type transport system permease protein|nr:putative uncharacterized protein [Odoribacter sp. CAG:788]HBO27742.1 ABC transporter permease [Culturomica sp.]